MKNAKTPGALYALEKSLSAGLIPIIWEAKDPLDKLKTYIALYLREL